MPPAVPDAAFPPGASATTPSLLLRVAGADEAALAASAEVDGVETSPEAAPRVRAASSCRLRVRCDEPPGEPPADADEISLPMAALPATRPAGCAIVARLPPSQATPRHVAALLDQAVAGRADAVTVEVAAGERLFAVAGIAQLDAFARACRAARLPFGFSGELEAPDVARLLLLAPDHLGFDRAARHGHRADAPLDRQAIAVLRGLVPRRGGSMPDPAPGGTLDRLFVRDLVLPLSIGAYRAEEDRRQRVRFTVEAAVARPVAAPRDMRDVVSYDIIVETIRMLAGRPHVTFVETLAEEIAATLLAQPRLVAVTVEVAKLDIIEGSVGILIERRRPQ